MIKQELGPYALAGSADDRLAHAPFPHSEPAPVPGALAQTALDQLAREVADIEMATAALRRAEPALESWTTTAAPTAGKPRPVWLIIGVLWLSTALVTAGAVVAIATLAG